MALKLASMDGKQSATQALPVSVRHDVIRYVDFAEKQHLRALANLCQNMDDIVLYAHLLAHKEEVGELIKRRRYLFQTLDDESPATDETDGHVRNFPRENPAGSASARAY